MVSGVILSDTYLSSDYPVKLLKKRGRYISKLTTIFAVLLLFLNSRDMSILPNDDTNFGLFRLVRRSLEDLISALKGEIIMSLEIEHTLSKVVR